MPHLNEESRMVRFSVVAGSDPNPIFSVVREVQARYSVALECEAAFKESGYSPHFAIAALDLYLRSPAGAPEAPALFPIDYSSLPDGSLASSDRSRFFANMFSFESLWELSADGLLLGDPNEIVVAPRGGMGGSAPWLIDLARWLYEIGVDVGAEATVGATVYLLHRATKWIRNGPSDRAARKVAQEWWDREIRSPNKLRIFIDRRGRWSTSELAKRLKLSPIAARKLLRALGYVADAAGNYKPGTTKKAIRRRERWESHERRTWPDK